MFSNTEIKNVINAYNVMKGDLHSLMVKDMKSPLDYEGVVELHPDIATIAYPINEKNQTRETYHALMDIGMGIESLLKTDLRLWGKTQGVKSLEVAPDRRCETIILEVIFQD